MKKLLCLLAAASMIVSCSRSGTTIANDDTAINSQLARAESNTRLAGDYPITEKDLPAEVRTNFYNRYPNANNIQWWLQRDGNYKADFFVGKTKWKAVYAPDGTLLFEEHA